VWCLAGDRKNERPKIRYTRKTCIYTLMYTIYGIYSQPACYIAQPYIWARQVVRGECEIVHSKVWDCGSVVFGWLSARPTAALDAPAELAQETRLKSVEGTCAEAPAMESSQ
jgi:hypothetical protein